MGKTLFIQGVGHGPSSEKIRCMSTHTCTLRSVRGSGNSRTHVNPSHALQPSPTEPGKHGDREPRYRRKNESPRPLDTAGAALGCFCRFDLADDRVLAGTGQARQECCCLPQRAANTSRMASIRKDRAENQPVEMILSDAEVAAVLTTSATPGANRSAPAKFSRPASHTNGRRNKSDKQLKTRRPRPQG
jgi:hypothetical protein